LVEFIAGSQYLNAPRLTSDAIVGTSSFGGPRRLTL
jgi:hypothetical protein